MKSFMEFLKTKNFNEEIYQRIDKPKKSNLFKEQNLDIKSIVQQYLNSDIGKKYKNYDCKTVTRAFIQWAESNGIQAKALHLAQPSIDFVKKNPNFGGKSGEGDSHIMPVINGYAIDFTARQFGLKDNTYENPLITPFDQVKSFYGKFGYYTDNPQSFGGESYSLRPWDSMTTMDTSFSDEIL